MVLPTSGMTISSPGSYQAGNRCKGSRQTLVLADPLKKQIKPKSLQAPQMTSLDDFPALPAIFSIHIVTILSLRYHKEMAINPSHPEHEL